MTSAGKQIDLLIVDDDDEFRDTFVRRFSREFQVSDAGEGIHALELTQRREFDVAVVDMMMPGISGLELLNKFNEQHIECEVIFLTGKGTIETAVQSMKAGAFDYLQKPFPMQELESVIKRAYDRRMLRKENRQLKALLKRSQPDSEMVGDSEAMQDVFRLIERAGPSDKAILIQGESGTGKELVARALHQHSERHGRPMVTINCAALTETLLESELFGHEKGAFTGAIGTKEGLFEVADNGTLFIDEIGEMPGSLQAKLLRVLEDGSMRRVGSIKERRVNVRILAATNRNLQEEVAEGRFREDLYYRINVMSLELPPIRERVGDIPLLVSHFLGTDWEIEDAAMEMLSRYDWPGNIRQLLNAIDRGKIMAEDHVVQLRDLPREIVLAPTASPEHHSSLDEVVDNDDLASVERAKVVEILQRVSGNKTRAAKVLGIDRRKLYRLLEKYEIQNDEITPLV